MAIRAHILIAEPSTIIRSGVIAVLQRSTTLNIDIAEVGSIASISDDLRRLQPDVLIINPAHLGLFPTMQLREACPGLRIVALMSSLTEQSTMKSYNESITIYDSGEVIRSTIERVIENREEVELRSELSHREKEIVVCVAKGMSNKEIADQLNLSTHTVISHRRNITSKLDIYSASGLTIYAIVNKLIDIESIPAK